MQKPKIYYYAPAAKKPSGGVRVIYRHVNILNENGFDACVVHQKKWFKKYRYPFSENKTKIVYVKKLKDLDLKNNDYLVLPELLGPHLHQLNQSGKIVIFNQNAYYTFRGGYDLKNKPLEAPYNHPSVVGVITVSGNSQNYINFVFPQIKTYRVHLSVDQNIFCFNQNKQKQIAFMPRKNPKHVLQIINILKAHGLLNNYRLTPIDRIHESEVAKIMRESLIFLTFGRLEGFQLPAAEALATGCVVIGYHGQGAQEFFTQDLGFPIESDHIIEFAKTVEDAIHEYATNPARLDQMRYKASQYIAEHYSTEKEEKELIDAWNNIIYEK